MAERATRLQKLAVPRDPDPVMGEVESVAPGLQQVSANKFLDGFGSRILIKAGGPLDQGELGTARSPRAVL